MGSGRMRKVLGGLVSAEHIWVSDQPRATPICILDQQNSIYSKPLELNFFTMDEFEQALNHVYTPPTQTRMPRAITLMVAVHAALLTHIQDRSEKPTTTGRSSILDSLEVDSAAWTHAYYAPNLKGEDTKVAHADAMDLAKVVKTSGAEEDTQAHVWRAKLGGVKVEQKAVRSVLHAVSGHSDGEWRGVKLLEVADHAGWEKVLLECLIEVGTRAGLLC